MLNAASLAQLGAADKTLGKDDLAWSLWDEFSAAYGWDPVVSRDVAVHFPDLLSSRLGLFTLYVYPLVRGRGRPDAHPRSVFNNYPGAICRIPKRDYKLPVPVVFQLTRSLMRAALKVPAGLTLAQRTQCARVGPPPAAAPVSRVLSNHATVPPISTTPVSPCVL